MDQPVRWTAKWPEPDAPAAGLPLLHDVRHHGVYRGGREFGRYSHSPKITRHNGLFLICWSSHAWDEWGPGTRVLFSTSEDGVTWSEPGVLVDSLSPVLRLAQGLGVFVGCHFVEVNGRHFL